MGARCYRDTPIRRYADTPIRRYADTPIRRYADTPIRRYADTPIRRYADTPTRLLPLPVDSDQGIQKILGADNTGRITFRIHDSREAGGRSAESPQYDRCLLIRLNGQNATNIMSDSGGRGPVNEQIKDIYQPEDLARRINHRITVKSGASRKFDELFDGCLPTHGHNFRKTDHDVSHFHRTKIDHVMNHSSFDTAQHPHPFNLAGNIF